MIQPGQSSKITTAFSQEDVNAYNIAIGDSNPVHSDEEYAAKTLFKKPIVPGMLVTSLFGGILGSTLPGKGTILLGETMAYKKPVYINEPVTAILEVIKIREDKGVYTFKAITLKENGEHANEGEFVVMYRGEFLK
jgi:enoyl-CoA hydratase